MEIDTSKFDAIERNNLSLLGRTHAPGMVYGVVHAGEVAFLKGYGDAIVEKQAVTADTVFRIASISKIFTAIAVMRLVDEGKLHLDDPVEKHLKSFRIRKAYPADPPITLRHLLTHTAGIGEFAPLLGYMPPFTTFGVARVGGALPPLSNLYRNELRPDRSPGQAWAYANHGFATLGQMLADVSGQSFPEVIDHLIFKPLGMARSDFLRTERVLPNLAKGYRYMRDRYWPVLDVDIITLADGSMFTTGADFAKFLQELTVGGGTIISKGSLSQMMRPHFQLDPHLPAMGLGFFLENRRNWGDQTIASHSGLWLGFHSSMMLAPANQLATFAFVNDANQAAMLATANGLRVLLPKDSIPKKEKISQNVDSDLTQKLLGTYQLPAGLNSSFRLNSSFGRTFTVYLENEQLKIKTRRGDFSQGRTLLPASNSNPLVFKAGQRVIVFQCDKNGQKIDRFYMRYNEFLKQ